MDYSIYRTRFRDGLRMVSETVSASVATSICGDVEFDGCRDDSAALRLKIAAIASILVAGVIGVALPLVVKKRRFLSTDGGLFLFFKAFAAGVILATGFVHMLADAEEALTDDCLPEWPWQRFPFPGFVAMVAALATLVVEFLTTQFYERKNRDEAKGVVTSAAAVAPADAPAEEITNDLVLPGTEERKEGMHIVGMHAHAAEHSHGYGHVHGHGYGHGNGHDDEGQVSSHVRHVVVSQILELGIVSHSMIIGLSLGVSQSPCTIRPLMAALSFHQFFEGFALGGCISQAQFKNLRAVLMASFFAITTPMGIAVGVAVASFYNANSPRALLVEGLLDSVSAGILIYMALVDLIAADFLSKSLSCNSRLQAVSYAALFIGALAMSGLAIWA